MQGSRLNSSRWPNRRPSLRSGPLGWPVGLLLFVPQAAVLGQALPRMSDTPSVAIGDSVELFRVRSVLAAGDRLLIADGDSQRILLFSFDGKPVGEVGRRGEGPGEFLGLEKLLDCGGQLLAWDGRLDRVSKIERGQVPETFRLPPLDDRYPQDLSCDGSRLVATYRVSGLEEMAPGPYRPPFEVHEFSMDGEYKRFLGRFPGDERYRFKTSDGPRGYGKKTIVLPLNEGLIVGIGDEFGLEEYDATGKSIREYRAPLEMRPLSSEEARASEEQQVRAVEEQYGPGVARSLRENFRRFVYPEFLPAYTQALLDDRNRLWVRRFKGVLDPAEVWEVFLQGSGHHLGSIPMPPRFRLGYISGGLAFGVWLDENDVEHVHVYRLKEGDGASS